MRGDRLTTESATGTVSGDTRPRRRATVAASLLLLTSSLASTLLNRMIFFGWDSLEHAISQFMSHYHAEGNHRGLEKRLLYPAPAIALSQPVRRRQRLGGMLNYYYRAAA
jgi:hypothetical protein